MRSSHEDEIEFDLDFELSKLRQQLDQFVIFYYKKTPTLWKKTGGKDRTANAFLFTNESFILNLMMKIFIRGLNDDQVRKDIIKKLVSINCFLKRFYIIAENINRFRDFSSRSHRAGQT